MDIKNKQGDQPQKEKIVQPIESLEKRVEPTRKGYEKRDLEPVKTTPKKS